LSQLFHGLPEKRAQDGVVNRVYLPAAPAVVLLDAPRGPDKLEAVLELAGVAFDGAVLDDLAAARLRIEDQELTLGARLKAEDLELALPLRRRAEETDRLFGDRQEHLRDIGIAAWDVIDPQAVEDELVRRSRAVAPPEPDAACHHHDDKERLLHACMILAC